MDFLVNHRYAASIIAAGFLILIGTLMVVNRSAVTPGTSYNTLDINGVIQATDPAVKIPGTPEPVRPMAVDVPYTKVNTPNKTTQTEKPKSDFFDWDSFVSALSHASPKTVNTADPSISDAYAFIPTGLISTDVVQPLNTMTASQKLLYGWGTDVGNSIQSYENSHTDQVAILTNFIQDREDSGKIAAMKKLGADLQAVGNSIDSIEPPGQMSMAGPALANGYREIGRNLAAIPDAKGDEALVKAILTYNKSAEEFVQKYVSVVLIFQANDVKFAQDEPGGVFMFPSQ